MPGRIIVPKSMKIVRHPDGKITIRSRPKLPGGKHASARLSGMTEDDVRKLRNDRKMLKHRVQDVARDPSGDLGRKRPAGVSGSEPVDAPAPLDCAVLASRRICQ